MRLQRPPALLSRLDRLVLGEIVGPFVFSVLLFTSFFFSGDLMKIMDLLSRGATPGAIAQILLLTLPQFVAWALPMAMLLAALLGIGRLSSDSELVALIASGLSFGRILVPVGAFAFTVALTGMWINDSLVPSANRGREAIIARVRQEVSTRGLGAGITLPIYDEQDGSLVTLIHVAGGLDLADNRLRDVSIQTWNRGRLTGTIYAERAQWVVGTRNWQLFNFWSATRHEDTVAGLIAASGRTVEMGRPQDLQAAENRPIREVSIATLQRRIRIFRTEGARDVAREAEVEIAQRIAVPFAAFVFALVGAPLGVRSRRSGKGVGIGLAIVIIFAYWTALQFCAYLGKAGMLPAALALALPNLVGLAIAYYLIRCVWIGEH